MSDKQVKKAAYWFPIGDIFEVLLFCFVFCNINPCYSQKIPITKFQKSSFAKYDKQYFSKINQFCLREGQFGKLLLLSSEIHVFFMIFLSIGKKRDIKFRYFA